MSVKPTLLVLAAGMSTRYGSLKQLDQFGPNGETIIDFSVYDALKAGFGKVIFVIREAIAAEFIPVMEAKFKGKVDLDFVRQELYKLPAGFKLPANRIKPWGTAHAIYVAAEKIKEPFAVINGDDFYGYESFKIIADFLQSQPTDSALVGYRLENTLSEHGSVARGICETDADGYLTRITEQTQVQKTPAGIFATEANGQKILLPPDQLVSLNLMGFPVTVLRYFETNLVEFLKHNADNPKAEFFLPSLVDNLIRAGQIRVKVLPSPEKWFGVTYPEDKPIAVTALHNLVAAGAYPQMVNEFTSEKSNIK
jgi:dTDP-glucose pyrophosphorylase